MSSLAPLLPGVGVTDRWSVLEDARGWAGLAQPRLREILGLIGDEGLTNLVVFAAIPPSEMRTALVAVRRASDGDDANTEWNIVENSRFNLMYNAIRHKFNMDTGDLLAPQQLVASAVAGAGVAPAAAAGGGSPSVKVKLSQTIMQGRDIEVEVLPPDVIATKRKLYVVVIGDTPMPEQQVTDIQLSAFVRFVVDMGQAPACDFGVWGPHGNRAERAMFFRAHFPGADGKWRTTEIRGPDSLEAWEACWDVFKTAAIMANIASVAALDYYAKKFKARVSRYHWAWHLAIKADWRCRTEFWVEEKRTQESFHASNPTMSAFEVERPWNSVIKASAKNTDWWHENLAEEAVLYRQGGGPDNSAKPRPVVDSRAKLRPGRSRSRARSPSRHRAVRSASPKRKVRPGRGGTDERRPDGRYLCAKDGTEICYAWSRHEGGCSNPCRGNPVRAHVCEFCRTSHRTVHCPDHPDWKSPSAGPVATISKKKAKNSSRK